MLFHPAAAPAHPTCLCCPALAGYARHQSCPTCRDCQWTTWRAPGLRSHRICSAFVASSPLCIMCFLCYIYISSDDDFSDAGRGWTWTCNLLLDGWKTGGQTITCWWSPMRWFNLLSLQSMSIVIIIFLNRYIIVIKNIVCFLVWSLLENPCVRENVP